MNIQLSTMEMERQKGMIECMMKLNLTKNEFCESDYVKKKLRFWFGRAFLKQFIYLGTGKIETSQKLFLKPGRQKRSVLSTKSTNGTIFHLRGANLQQAPCSLDLDRLTLFSFRDFDCETGSLDESMENIERGSLASFGR